MASLLLAMLCAHQRARAYVPARTTKSGKALRWLHSNCVPIRINSNGSKDMAAPDAIVAIRKALEGWQQSIAGCSYIRWDLEPDSPTAVKQFNGPAGPNENAIVFVEDWSHGIEISLTSTMFIDDPRSASDGQILDADIELNAQLYHYTVSGEPRRIDVQNVVTHELGHLLGLAHTCGARAGSLDWQGNAALACESAPAWELETTMYPLVGLDETKKRTTEADDIAGICETYPKEQDPGRCVAPVYDADYSGEDQGGCTVARGKAAAAAGWPSLVLLLAPFWTLRRRARCAGASISRRQ